MIDIEQMNSKQISDLINQVGYGHLGCIHEGKPHVISMQYYVEDGAIYFFTDRGIKSQDLTNNSDVCLQIEEVSSAESWRSVTIVGRAECLQHQEIRADLPVYSRTESNVLTSNKSKFTGSFRARKGDRNLSDSIGQDDW